MTTLTQPIIHQLCDIALQASNAIIQLVNRDVSQLQIYTKKDHSKVTQADLAAQDIIMQGLEHLPLESYPIVSEESEIAETANLADFDTCWLVDPLDGTRGFIVGDNDYTVNIALIENGYPIFGVIVHPQSNTCYWAAKGLGAYTYKNSQSEPLALEPYQPPPWRILTGKFQNQAAWDERLNHLGALVFSAQNSSIKFCTLAKNKADIYPRGSQISAWDTAAGQCILEQAGGAVIDFKGERLCYTGRAKAQRDKAGSGFFALSDKRYIDAIKELLNIGRSHQT